MLLFFQKKITYHKHMRTYLKLMRTYGKLAPKFGVWAPKFGVGAHKFMVLLSVEKGKKKKIKYIFADMSNTFQLRAMRPSAN